MNKKSKTETNEKTKGLILDMVQFLLGILKREKTKGGKFPKKNGRKYPKAEGRSFRIKRTH